jgi:aspartate/methionine/tyrosine aminotransferase
MKYVRMPIEIESPEQMGYDTIKHNLTESSYTDTIFKDIDLNLKDLVLCYGDHVGHRGLRKLLASEGHNINENNVLITVAAASALFIVATSLLEKGEELVVVRPNYATNIETPKAIGASIKYLDLKFEDGFKINMSELKKLVTKNTKYISITHPHNPTGVSLTESELKEIIKIAEDHGIYLLVDETYRDMNFKNKLPLAATYSENVICVSSLSKTYGLPGIRIGWIITRNKKLMETFLAAKEQIFICGSVVDEEIAYRYLSVKDNYFPKIKADIENKFLITKKWFNAQDDFEWVEPTGGVVCFPRIKDTKKTDVELFYKILNEKYSTYVGPGHWFEQSRSYMRVGYGWPSVSELEGGLKNLGLAVKEAQKR